MEETTSKPLTKKQLRRRERILSVAERHIYRHGFYKVSLDDLVKMLRISKSTIYEHFGSKEGLVEEIVERLGEKLESRLEELIINSNAPVADKLLDVAKFQGNAVLELTNNFTDDLKIHVPHLWDKYLSGKKRRVEKYYRQLIAEGFKTGLFDNSLDEEFVLRLFLAMSEIVCVTDILQHIPMTRPQAYKQVMAVFIKGVSK